MKLLTNLFLDIIQIVLAALAAHGINTSTVDTATVSEIAGVLAALAFSHVPQLRNLLPNDPAPPKSGGTTTPIILLFIGLALASGCATSTTGKLTQAEGVVIPAVNAAMGGWNTYVQSGKATQAQINAVQTAYNTYYTAQLAAEAALIESTAQSSTNALDLTAANTAKTTAENSLINLINSYIK